MTPRLSRGSILAWLALLGSSLPTVAGTFVLTPCIVAASRDAVTHPFGYSGVGGTLTIDVCIDPSSQFSGALEGPLRKAIATWNTLEPTTGQYIPPGSSNEVPADRWDAESVLLHELGHCLGLNHGNLGSQVLFFFSNATLSTTGPDGEFSFDFIGLDNKWGTPDDMRGDDENLLWFRRGLNDPFFIELQPRPSIDRLTFSRNLADLPASDSYAANAGPNVADELGYASSKSVMYSQEGPQSEFRTLVADDVDTLQYSLAGLDEDAGTSDDFSFQIREAEFPCDIPIGFVANVTADGVGECSVALARIGETNHYAVNPTRINLSLDFDWYFGPNPDLSVEKTANQAFVAAGQEIVYSILVRNLGDLESGPITVEERIPDNSSFSAESSDPTWCCADTSGGSLCDLSLPALPAGATSSRFSFNFRGQIPVVEARAPGP